MNPQLFDLDAQTIAWKLFFGSVKIMALSLLFVVGALVAGQSSVAPVSVRLLTSYGMEFAVTALKPLRPLFPEPYVIQFNTK